MRTSTVLALAVAGFATACHAPPAAAAPPVKAAPLAEPRGAPTAPGAHVRDAPAAVPPPIAVTPADAVTSPAGSQTVTWTCTGKPCPWGASLTGHAAVWPSTARALAARLGYAVSAGIYLAAGAANGIEIAIDAGAARVYAGLPDDVTHRVLATIEAGHAFQVTGLVRDEVLSLQAETPFTYRVAVAVPREPRAPEVVAAHETSAPKERPAPREPERPAPREPERPARPRAPRRDAIQATRAVWRCDAPGCRSPDWTGAVIAWPAWAAHQSNARRSGDQSRSVFSVDGKPLHPYMGPWANGCKVTCESGAVLIIEWKRGSEVWRETWLHPGQSHAIHLVPPEDSAMIETGEGAPGFSVSLKDCKPQPIQR